MNDPEYVVPEIDRMVHEPARLAILSVIAACERADFLFLERATGLTRGNLSVQLTRLEEAGLVAIEKTIERKRTLTTVSLARRGRQSLDSYWQAMEALRERTQSSTKRRVNAAKPSRRPAPRTATMRTMSPATLL